MLLFVVFAVTVALNDSMMVECIRYGSGDCVRALMVREPAFPLHDAVYVLGYMVRIMVVKVTP